MHHRERLFTILQYIVSPDSPVTVLQKEIMSVLKSLTYKTDHQLSLGALGIIEQMLKIIEERLKASMFLTSCLRLIIFPI